MNKWSPLDAIAPKIRAVVTKVKYGNSTELDLANVLEHEAILIRQRVRKQQQLLGQETLDL